MFDLNAIEKDWLNNSFKLSEEEIIEIYRSENITLNKYDLELEEYRKNTKVGMTAEERLLLEFFGEYPKIMEDNNNSKEKYEYPTRKYLSKDLQKKVIEGSLYIVFDSTREWYKFFNSKLSMERIYYVCLEALINSTKYMLHCEKPVFELYVIKSIERNMIKHVAKWAHITYRKAYEIIKNYVIDSDYILECYKEELGLLFNFDNKEEVEKPSKIYYQLKDESYDVNYIKNISSQEFMKDYINSLNRLDNIEKIVMQLTFDKDGNRGLTNNEIADYLGIEAKNVSNIRKRAIKTLRKDLKLNTYYRY